MNPDREYLSEMDIFKVMSESRSIKYECKIYPEKGMSPKSKPSSLNTKSTSDVLNTQEKK